MCDRSAEKSSDSKPLLSVLVSSLHSSKATLLCKPRPQNFDVDDLRLGAACVATGSKPEIEHSPAAAAISELLEIRSQQYVPLQALATDSRWKACAKIVAETPWQAVMGRSPDVVLCNTSEKKTVGTPHGDTQIIYAYHGTAFENVWSILSCGFVNAAQVSESLGRYGHARSLYGKGIYLSLEPSYAASFVRPSPPLLHALGRWRCLFLCEVTPGPMVTVGGEGSFEARSEESGGLATKDAHNVPEGVVVAENSESVRVCCALLWHAPDTQRFGGLSIEAILACVVAVIACLYVVWDKHAAHYWKLR